MKKDKDSKEYLHFIAGISIFLFLCGMMFLFVGALMQRDGVEPNMWIIFSGFFGCEIACIILLCYNLEHFINSDLEKKLIKYDNTPFSKLHNISLNAVYNKLTSRKFQLVQSKYLRKKVFSFFKDSVCYYVKCVDSLNIEKTIKNEFVKFDSINEKTKNICFILFMYKDNLRGEDFQDLRYYSKFLIIDETLVPKQYYRTAITVLVDRQNNEGYYLDIQSKYSISIYAHGCRLLNEVFNSSKNEHNSY